MPMPPINRATINASQFHANAQPIDDKSVQDGHDPQRLTAADLLPERAGGQRPEDRTHQTYRNRPGQQARRQMKDAGQLLGRASDHGRIEPKQQAAQRARLAVALIKYRFTVALRQT